MGEYQSNYDMNSSRKDDKIAEMNAAIQARCNLINELEGQEHMTLEFMQTQIYNKKVAYFTKRKVFAAMKYRYEVYKRNQRLERSSVANAKQKRLKNLFDAIRKHAHQNCLERLDNSEQSFRAELESKILV